MAKLIRFTNIAILISILVFSCKMDDERRGISFNDKGLSKEFNNYFQFIKTVYLDDDVLIADISYLDVNDEGDLLVTDKMRRKVFLFSRNGKLMKELKYTKCNPGYKWKPEKAQFKQNGEIIILDPRGLKFTAEGDCIGEMNASFLWPGQWAFLTNGNIVGYYAWPGIQPKLSVLDEEGKELLSFGKFSSEFRNLLARGIEYAGLVIDKDDNIYQLNPFSLHLFKYDKNFSLKEEFALRLDNISKMDRDIRAGYFGGPNDLQREFNRVVMNKTRAWGCDLLDDETIIIYYLHTKEKNNVIFIQLYSTNGKYLLEEDLKIDQKFAAAKNGYVYKVIQPEPDDHGNLPNPAIEIYKYNERRI